ncbi:MAG: MCE family protein [Elusimicrobia bacterium]|jgi:phospholipid/cholesterol/gamma-HCH transport system substrate-binding protein|nr:MCE family protein [Elusimicrobiota bacterium]
MSLSTETKVGLFSLSGLFVFALGVIVLGDFQFHGTYPLYVYFDNALGLPEKGPVKVAGVEVGQVERIDLDRQRARVKVQVRKGIEVHQGTKAQVASTGFIGSKYLEMTLGDPAAPVLSPGDSFEGTPTFTFDDVMSKLGAFLKEDPDQGAVTDNLRVTVANFRRVSQALADSLGTQRAELTEIIRNIRDASAHAKHVASDLREITGERKEDIKIALEKFRSISERLDQITERVQKGDGLLGRLVNDPELGKNLDQTMANVNKATHDLKGFTGRISAIKIYWDYRQRYDMEDQKWRPDLGITMVPRPGKYYYLAGNNLGAREDRSVLGTDLEKKNTITAVMGHDFGPVTLYGGAIRSAGGAGVRVRPFPKTHAWNRRVEGEAEAYNFGRDEMIQGHHFDKPVYNVGARVKAIEPWLWVGAQIEDVSERKNFNVNANIMFRDEDLAFLLGLVGLAR